MTREEITAKIEDLEERKFFLDMKDRWARSDYDYYDKLTSEIRELEKLLN